MMFGMLDIESLVDDPYSMIWTATYVELLLFAPVGLIHGAITGLVFMTLRFMEKNRRGSTHGYGGAYKGYQEVKR